MDEVHARRKVECDEGTRHHIIQGACWYCDRTPRQIEIDEEECGLSDKACRALEHAAQDLRPDAGMVSGDNLGARAAAQVRARSHDCIKSDTGRHVVIDGSCQYCGRTQRAIDDIETAQQVDAAATSSRGDVITSEDLVGPAFLTLATQPRVDTPEDVHHRRAARCRENAEHYLVQGRCWYCERTPEEIDLHEHVARSTMADLLPDREMLRGDHPAARAAARVREQAAGRDAATAASTPGEHDGTSGAGDEQAGGALASTQPRVNGQFARKPGTVPVPEHIISRAATKRANKRMQKVIEKGSDREAVAAYKLLYGQPPPSKGKQTPDVPTQPEATAVELPQPPDVPYSRSG